MTKRTGQKFPMTFPMTMSSNRRKHKEIKREYFWPKGTLRNKSRNSLMNDFCQRLSKLNETDYLTGIQVKCFESLKNSACGRRHVPAIHLKSGIIF